MYQGDEVAAVAAATEEQARDALRLIKVQYEVLPHIATEAQALQAGAPNVFKDGNITEGEARGERRSRRRLQGRRPHRRGQLPDAGADARLPRDARLRLRVGGRQADVVGRRRRPSTARAKASPRRSAFPQANVRVITEYMGGGFGSKFGPDVAGRRLRQAREAGGRGR